MPQGRSIVVIPVYKSELSRTELFSLHRCLKILADAPIVIAGPRSLDYGTYDAVRKFDIETFDDRFFVSLETYSELLLTEEFYARFADYEFILIHQLDAFVFTNQLEYWCARGYDYIGAPWQSATGAWGGVGNGGLSLRRVAGCLGVIRSVRKENPHEYWEYVKRHTPTSIGRALRYHRRIQRHLGIGTDVITSIRRFLRKHGPEDKFWGLHANRFEPGFCVAPVDEALRFSVEAGLEDAPCYSTAPPFGCHRQWFLEMLEAYLYTNRGPNDSYESRVWQLARLAGMERSVASN